MLLSLFKQNCYVPAPPSYSHKSKKMIHQISLVCLCLLNTFMFYGYVEAKVSAVIVFGDSTVDPGNNNYIKTILRSNFPPYGRDFPGGIPTGRFSNGRLVSDFISEGFGLKQTIPAYLDPGYGIKDFATGVSFASAGTGYDNLTSNFLSVIPMWKELEYFKEYKKKLFYFMGENNAKNVLREALFVISVGTNDFIENYYINPAGQRAQFTVDEYSNFLFDISESFIRDIYNLGARKISVSGFPPIGCLPLVRSLNIKRIGACRADYNKLARDFDGKTIALAAKLNKELTGINILFLNVYNPILQVINKPQAYGLEIADMACCGTGTIEFSYLCNRDNPFTCMDANKYVFWDTAHPTEKLYHIVADQLMNTTLAELV